MISRQNRKILVQVLKYGLGLFFLIFCTCAKAQLADVYIRGGGSYTYFLRSGEIQIDKNKFAPQFGVGLSFYINEEKLWKLKSEFNYAGRGYTTNYPNSEFNFLATGIELAVLAEYPISQKLNLEAGFGAYFYEVFLFENGVNKKLGDQANSLDINVIAGINYQVYEPLFIGFRTKFGLIPMVDVKPVDKYGEIQDKRLLNALTPELVILVKLYRRKK